eukprot:gene1612-1760_t
MRSIVLLLFIWVCLSVHISSVHPKLLDTIAIEGEEEEDLLHSSPHTVHPSWPPLFVIGGVQKAGTTALAAYLGLHPNITFSDTKELHFFDKNKNYKGGLRKYLWHFTPNMKTTQYIGESTPSYLPSRIACSRLAKHFPNVKVIVILRHPIDRAYSEYQMKTRRVQEQTDFLTFLQNHLIEVYTCLRKYPTRYKDILSCLPQVIREHGRIGKLKKALRLAYQKLGNWNYVLDLCFSNYSTSTTITAPIESEAVVSVEGESAAKNGLVFHAQRCWSFYREGYEYLPSLQQAFQDEIEAFINCSRYNRTQLAEEGDLLDQLQWLDHAIDRCIEVKSGISMHYFYRSLYAVQLFHCYKSLSPEQFLIVGNKELREHPHQVVSKVLSFLGMDPSTLYLPSNREELDEIAANTFPSFEKTTAWRLNSFYEPMPSTLRHYLDDFFSDFNRLLFELENVSSDYYW